MNLMFVNLIDKYLWNIGNNFCNKKNVLIAHYMEIVKQKKIINFKEVFGKCK